MHQKNQHRAQSIQPSDMHCTVGVHHVCHDIKHHVNYGRLFQLTYFYYYCYAAFNAPCVGHKDNESQVQTQKVSGHHQWDILLEYLNNVNIYQTCSGWYFVFQQDVFCVSVVK